MAPHPPGPGLPRHAPSVNTSTTWPTGPAGIVSLSLVALRVIPEAVQEAAEHAALTAQGRLRRRGHRTFRGLRLAVVGPRDGVHDLGIIEVLRAGDLSDEADQIPVEQHLRLQGRGVFPAPDRLAPVTYRHAYPVHIDAALVQVRVDAAVPEGIGHPPCPVPTHAPT